MYLVIYRIQKKDIEICGSQRLRLQVVLATLRREKNRLPRRARERCRDPCLPRDQLVYSARIPCWWKSISLGVSHSIIFDGIVLTTEDVQVHLSTVSRITVAWDGLAISRYYYSRFRPSMGCLTIPTDGAVGKKTSWVGAFTLGYPSDTANSVFCP
jgi:hypothetical protein